MESHSDKKTIELTESSFREIFDLYFEPICRFLNYYTHDKNMIEDIVQDIFVKLWEERETCNITFIKSYLYTAARNRMFNHIRNQQTRMQLLENWAVVEIEKNNGRECIDMNEFHSVLQETISKLPEKCREIFNSNRKEELTYNQIASKYNISVKTVEAQMSTALKRIKQQLLAYYQIIQNF